jgi:transglutaminase-like putative cysteine protease
LPWLTAGSSGVDADRHALELSMRLKLGYELVYDCPKPTPMIALLNVHASRVNDLEAPDLIHSNPPVPMSGYHDSFGNWCTRMLAPAGRFVLTANTVIRDSGVMERFDLSSPQHPVENLPAEVLQFLLGSRYCETDHLSNAAWAMFGHLPPDAGRVQAICDFVHNHITFDYQQASPTRTAREAHELRFGVCRDFTHLAITLCRCMNIPTRYCTGYISDVGLPPPYATMDFCAWMEVYLGGRWHTFDPRNNASRAGRVLMATGRDAADVPLTHTFGGTVLSGFKVWIDEIKE